MFVASAPTWLADSLFNVSVYIFNTILSDIVKADTTTFLLHHVGGGSFEKAGKAVSGWSGPVQWPVFQRRVSSGRAHLHV